MTAYTDLVAGHRQDITVEFVTTRPVEVAGERVERLLMSDHTNRQFAVLVTPAVGPLRDLQTGASYRLEGLLVADPVVAAGDGPSCPDCDGELRPGEPIDTVDPVVRDAAGELGLAEAFGILDAETTMRRVDPEGPVDDWQSMRDERPVDVPDYICPACERHVTERELRTDADRRLENPPLECAAPLEASAEMASPDTVGLAAGGATDVTNFRENVANEYTPQPEAISDEGLFYDYHFETGERASSTPSVFAPRYAAAVSEHPITGELERYLSVGLDSSLAVDEFERPRLDLVAVLDVSGSMDGRFDQYYYDDQSHEREAKVDGTTKLEAATQALCALTEQFRPEDRLGVVLYNHRAHVAKPLRDIGTTDMPAIRRHIREVSAGGSTNLADGFEAAVDMLVPGATTSAVEQRVVFLTDMMPNTGSTGESELTDLVADAAADGIHTTFVGIGLDENAALADTLSGIRGANHYYVHSADEFERRLGEEFDYMVTPLVYDLELSLETDGYDIEGVLGAPGADPASGQLLQVGTLFPSAKEDGEARGGIVLVRLDHTEPDADCELVASWTDRGGDAHTERVTVSIPDDPETFAHDGVRKAVALARYARELRSWACEVHDWAESVTGVDDWQLPDQRGDHERESVPLVVPEQYVDRFGLLQSYLADERDALGDDTLQQELDLLATLVQEAPTPKAEVCE